MNPDTDPRVKVTGVSIIRNAIKYDYPIIESLNSLLPICDEVIVSVGNSTDDTKEIIESIGNNKLIITDSIWDETIITGGSVLANETNKVIAQVSQDSDWIVYLQADEVLHQDDYDTIRQALIKYSNDDEVEGLLFNYRHFYGSYKYVGNSRKWYRREIRAIKNNRNIYSYRDAQGFRIGNDRKLKVAHIPAFVHHYGWVKPPDTQREKIQSFIKLWHQGEELTRQTNQVADFNYHKIDSLAIYQHIHPSVMFDRIIKQNWDFDYDVSIKNLSKKDQFTHFIEHITGYRIGEYKPYKIVKSLM
ncbi:MAG: glycosyltransferase family 2 protein [Bacteroidota bacterium]|nr:glycosyltransferase family 2 protein [Bacteroidota bacterium]